MPSAKAQKKRKDGKPLKSSSGQKRKYSGKKKRHTNKVQVIYNPETKRIISITVARGSMHDFAVFKGSRLKIHKDTIIEADSGYQGAQKMHTNTVLPTKKSKNKKLTKEEKRKNKEKASNRIVIEHVNAKLKVFKIMKYHYRSHSRFGLRATLVAIFVNANVA